MAKTIDIYVAAGTVSLTEGSDGVHLITVHYYFANVVDIIITMDNGDQDRYYQVPCKLHTPAP